MISAASLRKDAERFGWSASVWLSKQLNGRQPVLMAKPVVTNTNISEEHRRRREDALSELRKRNRR